MSAAIADIGHNNPPTHAEMLAEKYHPHADAVTALADRANDAPRKIASDDDLSVVGGIIQDARRLSRSIEGDRKAEKEPHLVAGREVDGFFAILSERLDRISVTFQRVADDHAREKAAEARRKAEEEARAARAEAERQAEIARRAEEANRLKTASTHDARAEAAAERAEQAETVASSSAADLTRQRLDSGILSTAKTEWAFEITDYAAIPLDALKPYLKREAVEAAIRQHVKFHKGASPLPGVRFFEDVKAVIR